MIAPGILDYFPLKKIRPIQERALLEVFEAFESGKKFVFLEAPPGVGKSALAVTLSRYYRSSYVLTKTLQLQAQYVRDFEDAAELKGRSNFKCEQLRSSGGTCRLGADMFKNNPCFPPVTMASCPYRVAKAEALLSDLTVCNYMSYLYAVGTTPWSSATLSGDPVPGEEANWHRPLLILDEAHSAEEVMMDYVSVTVDGSSLPVVVDWPFPEPTNVEGCFAWLELFTQFVPTEHVTPEKKVEVERLQRKALFALSHRDADKWISEPLKDKVGFVLKPLTVKSFAGRLFVFGDRVLLMSATILDAAKMATSLGITDYAYVNVPCPFPVENRPIIVANLNMTKQYRESFWPAMVGTISTIMEQHAGEKGLILCPSNEMVDYIINGISAGRSRFISARGETRLIDYQRHIDAKYPSILIAAGFWEGADLKDELSRFQILPAIPRPYWGGQIEARGRIDPDWYRLQALMQLIQGVGRSVRSETDSAVTYIFDRALREEASRSDSMLPPWFREALIYA